MMIHFEDEIKHRGTQRSDSEVEEPLKEIGV